MHLKILLPSQLFSEVFGVTRIVAESQSGSFGILDHRRDCVAVLIPGIFTYATDSSADTYLALDTGVLVKTGAEILVSVLNAIGGIELAQLRQSIQQNFLHLNAREKENRNQVAKLETSLVHRFVEFHHE